MGRIRKPKSRSFKIVTILYRAALPTSGIVFVYTRDISLSLFVCCLMIALGISIKILRRHLRYKRFLNSGLNVVDRMSGTEFEEFLLVHFRQLGYKAKTTPATGDYGADLVLEKDGTKTVVQAKRWRQKVGVEAVQQILGAMGYYKASKAIVITNNYCSENAHVLASSNNIEIWNRDVLQEFMNKTNGKASAVYVSGNSNYSPNVCPECSGKLILKYGKYGEFLGCSSYPGCDYTRKIHHG